MIFVGKNKERKIETQIETKTKDIYESLEKYSIILPLFIQDLFTEHICFINFCYPFYGNIICK